MRPRGGDIDISLAGASSFLVWENALPAGAAGPGLNRRPGGPNAFASTAPAAASVRPVRTSGRKPDTRSHSSGSLRAARCPVHAPIRR